jgi:hypothetical protein
MLLVTDHVAFISFNGSISVALINIQQRWRMWWAASHLNNLVNQFTFNEEIKRQLK